MAHHTDIGPARTGAGLARFAAAVRELRAAAARARVSAEPLWNQSFIDSVELENMLDAAEAVASSARARDRSLGAHVRLDERRGWRPFARPASIVVRREADGAPAIARLPRAKTPWRRLLPHLARDLKRKVWLKLLRLAPLPMRDRIVEKRYRATMGEIAAPAGGS